jgi:hypothetical protein
MTPVINNLDEKIVILIIVMLFLVDDILLC